MNIHENPVYRWLDKAAEIIVSPICNWTTWLRRVYLLTLPVSFVARWVVFLALVLFNGIFYSAYHAFYWFKSQWKAVPDKCYRR